MSPNLVTSGDILTDENYFLWEFTTRMTLARKGVLEHVLKKPETMEQSSTWKVNDLKALAIIVKLLSPTYQTMVRRAQSAYDAWDTLRSFFVQQNLHNKVHLRKKLSKVQLEEGGNLMNHLMQFDELCLKLVAVGETIGDNEKLVILLGSLPQEYDMLIPIIEATSGVTLMGAKEMLRREYETLQKRDEKEMAFKTIGRKGHRGCGSRKGGSYHHAGQPHDSKIWVKVCSSWDDVTNANDMGIRKTIVQKEGREAVMSLYFRQKLDHRSMNTISGCLTAVQSAICQATKAISLTWLGYILHYG